jgi:hypothetical protein
MGLDMYAFSVSAQDAGDNVVDLERGDESGNTLINSTELFYWRKFNALHGWMEQLYRAKGGTAESFNCNTVRLTSEDLDKLERDANSLQPVAGFFFGSQTVYPEDIESIAEFVAKARQAIADGNAVYYDSWW